MPKALTSGHDAGSAGALRRGAAVALRFCRAVWHYAHSGIPRR